METVKFVIISYQRTGSTYLTLKLNNLNGIICHSELFNRGEEAFKNSIFDTNILPNNTFFQRILGIEPAVKLFRLKKRDPIKFLNHIYNQNASAVGFKIFPGQNDEVLNLLLNDDHVKKILLDRENLLRSFTSKKIAIKSGNWSRKTGEEASLIKVYINPAEFIQYVGYITNKMNDYREVMNSTDQIYLDLTYEKFVREVPLQQIVSFLGLNLEVEDTDVDQSIQNPFPLNEMIINYDELLFELRDTQYEDYLIEQ